LCIATEVRHCVLLQPLTDTSLFVIISYNLKSLFRSSAVSLL